MPMFLLLWDRSSLRSARRDGRIGLAELEGKPFMKTVTVTHVDMKPGVIHGALRTRGCASHTDGIGIVARPAGRAGYRLSSGSPHFARVVVAMFAEDVPHDLYISTARPVAGFTAGTLSLGGHPLPLRIRRGGDDVAARSTEANGVASEALMLRGVVPINIETGSLFYVIAVSGFQCLP